MRMTTTTTSHHHHHPKDDDDEEEPHKKELDPMKLWGEQHEQHEQHEQQGQSKSTKRHETKRKGHERECETWPPHENSKTQNEGLAK